jgi:predicted ester cyclase
MSQTPDALMRQWFKEVWDEGRAEAIDRHAAANQTVHGLGGPTDPPMIGKAAFKQLHQTFMNAFGDLTVTVEKTVVQGDQCAAVCRVAGRHVGDALGGHATNKEVNFTGITIGRIANGKLVEGWNVFDFLGMYQQIGWVKTPPTP